MRVSRLVQLLKWPAILGMVLTVVSLLMIFFFQDALIFQSEKLEATYEFSFDEDYREISITTLDSETLNALLFSPVDSSKGLIIYFHGNAGNLKRWGAIASQLTSYNYHVLVFDYRGYGKSTGTPGERVLYQDAETVWQWAKSNLQFNELVIYGRSLGSAVASNLAVKANPKLLVLETPFDNLLGAVNPVFRPLVRIFPLRYTFPTIEHLAQSPGRKLIFHGTDDPVVSLGSALKLKSVLQSADEFIILEGGNHDNLVEFENYQVKLAEALR